MDLGPTIIVFYLYILSKLDFTFQGLKYKTIEIFLQVNKLKRQEKKSKNKKILSIFITWHKSFQLAIS